MSTVTTSDPDDDAFDNENVDDPEARHELLMLAHKIRTLVQQHAFVKRRRRWAKFSAVAAPMICAALYGMWWMSWVPTHIAVAVTIPAPFLVAGLVTIAVNIKRNSGGSEEEGELLLKIDRVRDERKHLLADTTVSFKVRRITYKEDAFADIDQLRTESKGYRRVNNTMQGILIIGSLAATASAGVAAEFAFVPWLIMAITFTVGVSSGFMGYFKYKERSFYLQQTADSIEQEWEAYEVGVGRYKLCRDNQELALAEFVEEVHRLKSEQKKRQQNLEQPPEIRGSGD